MSPCQYKHNTGFNVVVHLWTGVVVVFFVYFATLKGFLSLFFIQYGCLVDQMCVCRLRKKSHRLNIYTHTHTVLHKVYITGVSPLKTKCTIIKKEYNNNSFNTDILHIAHNVRPVVIR